MHTFFKTVALAVFSFLAISFAGVVSASAQNNSDVQQSGPCNVALVGQVGSNWSLVDQENYGNCSKGNSAAVLQLGSNAQYTGQFGKQNEALTIQVGSGNFAGTLQDGKRNDSSVIQLGDNNLGGAYQNGKHNESEVLQMGDGNLGGAIQLGNGNSSQVQQMGDGNLAVVVQLN